MDLKIGLEIHQQLNTKKLFCNCPSILRDDPHDITLKRRLKPVVGELGEIDKAALHELEKGKHFTYQAYSDSTCLVEQDSEPPHLITKDALKAALEISLLLNTKIVDEIQVMRKTVIDGSNTSGFQRTALIAYNGYIKTSKGRVGIESISLEEDAARKIKETKDSVTYRLDRLGIPLIEITTAPDIKDSEHAKEVAEYIGMLLRSTDKTKRGIGTIRQDINLSISNNPRIELKGFQNLRIIPKVIEKEIKRQLRNFPKKPEVRRVNPDTSTTFLRPMPGASRMYPESDLEPIPITKYLLDKIKIPELLTEKAIKLEKEYKLNSEISKLLVKNNLFLKLVKKFPNLKPLFLAQTLVLTPKEIKKRYNLNISKIKPKHFEEILTYYNSKKISKEAVQELLIDVCNNKKINISKYKTSEVSEKEIKKIIIENKNLSFNAYMGLVLKKYKVDPSEVAKILKKLL
ncbi:Glu-tRNA(Gln) amidotransferase GatDE subunit E [archaeon]|nr:Glu-tRNA(Gln) amidotransferase GatDE subunit E [archaeon]|tara:strand:+ start:1651 stop:3030 length:1380 start_codon:yes stop_codon:yes gene_type:complete